jgi:hypothetical protein
MGMMAFQSPVGSTLVGNDAGEFLSVTAEMISFAANADLNLLLMEKSASKCCRRLLQVRSRCNGDGLTNCIARITKRRKRK